MAGKKHRRGPDGNAKRTGRRPRKPSRPARPEEIKRSALLDPFRFPIVGIGASAGGLEAFSELLHAMPADPGLAIILVPHLAPTHESVLPHLLSARTALPGVQASE